MFSKEGEGGVDKFIFRNKFILPLIIVVVFLLVASLFVFAFWHKKTLSDNNENSSQISKSLESVEEDEGALEILQSTVAKKDFAQVELAMNYEAIPVIPFKKIQLNNLENLDSFKDDIQFSNSQKNALEEDGFFLTDNSIINDQKKFGEDDDFVDMYDFFDGNSNQYYRKPDDAVFISSDLVLHLYHILVDRSFQRMEEIKFQPMLKDMTEVLLANSIKQYNSVSSEKLKESYKRLAVFYLVPLVILDAGSNTETKRLNPSDYETFAQYLDAEDQANINASQGDLNFSLDSHVYNGFELSDDIYELAQSELQLIKKASGISNSPLFSPWRPEFKNDYSQFKPRSHYTKNDILKSYFIAMMWYGRMGFTVNSLDLTRDALIITQQINSLDVKGEKLSKQWSDMMEVINFFVGEVDDLTVFEYGSLVKDVYGDGVSISDFLDDDKLILFIKKVKETLPAPRIVSEVVGLFDNGGKRDELLNAVKQFRFMGQRFTPDAYVINNLTQGIGSPDPETGQMLPSMPTALMPLNVIKPNNKVVENYLNEWISDPLRIAEQGRESDKIIAKILGKLKIEFADYQSSIWTQNIYWSWLDCFRSLLSDYGEGYPYFMQTKSWSKKNLGTVLGSYAELKHDTLLYAKQSYAELGGGGNNPDKLPPVVKGYVEPDLDFWKKITYLAKITEQGLKDRQVFPEEFVNKYQVFIESVEFFTKLAAQELQNDKISDEDFEKLRTISVELNKIVQPINGQVLTDKEKRAGIIADIHTDAVKQKVLYEATGKPLVIYVGVSDVNGSRLTRGAVFNHYEFTEKLDQRLSDEDWQARVYDNQRELPVKDKWSESLIK
jgi:hypothetical protein